MEKKRRTINRGEEEQVTTVEQAEETMVVEETKVEDSVLATVFNNCEKIEDETVEQSQDTVAESTEDVAENMGNKRSVEEMDEESKEVTNTKESMDSLGNGVEKGINNTKHKKKGTSNYTPKKIGDTSKKIPNAKEVAEGYGAEFVSDNVVYAGVGSMLGNKIRVEQLYQRKNAQRVYSITEETTNGEIRGKYSKKSIFSRNEVTGKSKQIENYILSFVDNYIDPINNIMEILQIIENNRLLKVTRRSMLDSEVMTTEQIFERVGQYLIDCISDERVIVVEMSGKLHAGIVGRGNKTAYQNFRSLISEIAPENDYKIFKDDCIAKGLFITDYNPHCNDCLKTLSKKYILNKGVRGDSFYSFKFNDDVLEKIKVAYEEDKTKQNEIKEG